MINVKNLRNTIVLSAIFPLIVSCAAIPTVEESKETLNKEDCTISKERVVSVTENTSDITAEEDQEIKRIIGKHKEYIGFDQDCAKTRINNEQLKTAFEIMAKRSAIEIADPQKERKFSERLLAGLESKFPAIRKLSEDAMKQQNIKPADLKQNAPCIKRKENGLLIYRCPQ